jgi:hypothetical protein
MSSMRIGNLEHSYDSSDRLGACWVIGVEPGHRRSEVAQQGSNGPGTAPGEQSAGSTAILPEGDRER